MDGPLTASTPKSPNRYPELSLYVLVAGVSLLLLVLRKPQAFINPQMWAEDALIFFIHADQYGLAAIIRPYSGYILFWPRIVALFAEMTDPCAIPWLYMLASVAAVLVTVVYVMGPRIRLPFKPAAALALTLVPHSGEVFLTMTNVQWVFAIVMFALLLARPAVTNRELWLDCLIVAVFGLTGPFSVLFAPIFCLRAVLERGRSTAWPAVIAVLCAGVQGWFILHAPHGVSDARSFSTTGMAAFLSWRLIGFPLFGMHAPGWLGAPLLQLVGVAFAGITAWIGWKAPAYRRSVLYMALGVAAICVAATVKMRFDLWGFDHSDNADRYFYIPRVFMIWIVLVGVSLAGRTVRIMTGAVFACMLVVHVTTFQSPPLIDTRWCDYAPAIRAGEPVDIPINPKGWVLHYPGRSKR